MVSGLCINRSKCALANLNIQDSIVDDLPKMINCEVLQWPLTYLGVPLGGDPCTESFWDLAVNRISKRLENWRGVYFLGRRITLIQVSLSSITLYYLSLFKISVGVANRIEKIIRDFLWSRSGEGKKDYLVSW